MTGTDLKIITPAAIDVLGPGVDYAPQLRTDATNDYELLAVWLKSHRDGSAHTRRAYERTGRRFLGALGTGIRFATVENVQAALDVMRTTDTGAEAKPATVNAYVAAIKSFLNFAYRIGYTRFNAAPVIKLRKAPRQLAQKLMSEFDTQRLIHACQGRDRLMLETAYYGALRVSELVSLRWGQLIPRDSGEVQLELVGKGQKARQVLLPVALAARLLATRGDAGTGDPVFRSQRGGALTERGFNFVVKAAALRAGVNPAASAHWLRHAHASHAIDNGAPVTLVSQTLGHADLKTTSVYAHAKPNDSSSRYLKGR